MDEQLSEATLRLAYKFVFGRAAESDDVVRHALTFGTVGRLRDALFNSREFDLMVNRRPRTVRTDAPQLDISWRASDVAALAMLQTMHQAWAGASAPAQDATAMATALVACLSRSGLAFPDGGDVFELHCGGTPTTAALAERARVSACDVARATDLRCGMLAPFDLWYSFHALRHCPPPLSARVLAHALALLRPGGAAVFQLLSYGYGYSYDLAAPPPPAADAAYDLHVLPQTAVFALAADAGCAVCEVFDDLSVPPAMLWRSSVFVLRKPA